MVFVTIIVFILMLGFLISIHEFGHFIVAKHFNVYCGQFSIGMGPKVYSHQFGETKFELRLLPIGGFVSMAGEDGEVDNELFKDVPLERTIKGLKCWKKVCIFLAGVFMNFVSAYIIIVLVYLLGVSVSTNSNQLGTIVEDSPAMKAGFQVNDIMESITNEEGEVFIIDSFDDLSPALNKESNGYEGDTQTFYVEVLRDEEEVSLTVEASYNESTGNYYFGVSPTTKHLNLTQSFKYGLSYCLEVSTLILDTLKQLFSNTKETVSQLSGPVGIYEVTSEVTSSGSIMNLFQLIAMLGINLGVFNLLPIPGLDGYQVLVALVERIIGRELPANFKVVLQLMGLALVFGLMIVVTCNDIFHIF